jgi:hypothetical protein
MTLINDLTSKTISRESVALISDLENLIPSRSDGAVGRLGDNLGLHLVGILLVDHLHTGKLIYTNTTVHKIKTYSILQSELCLYGLIDNRYLRKDHFWVV